MKKLEIALLAGGDSSEREVSIGSAQQVCDSLDRSKYNVYMIDVRGIEWNYSDQKGKTWPVDKNDFSLPLEGHTVKFDYALIMIHGTPGEDGRMQGYLDMMRVPYSTCDLISTVLTFDKDACKRAVEGTGVHLAKQVILRRGDSFDGEAIVSLLGLPLFVKPNASGSSCGVTKVKTADELPSAIETALCEGDAVLIEEFIDGREFGCGVLVTEAREIIFPLTEIVSKKEFFDYQAKYTPGFSDEITPADIDDKNTRLIQELALAAYRACGCRGICRVDFILCRDGKPYMVEINTVPGMSAGSIVPKQAAAVGMTLGELFDIIINDTCR